MSLVSNASTSSPRLPRLRRALICVLLAGCALNFSGCFIYRKLVAKDLLNTGTRFYNAGKYELAAAKFKEAADLNPDLVQARLFYATALRSQVLQNTDPKNVDLALKAIGSYQEVIRLTTKSEEKDQAYAFIADLYNKIDKIEEQRKWLEDRATLPGQKPEIAAQCYYAIGVTYWDAAHKISDKYLKPGTLIAKSVTEWDSKDKETVALRAQEGLTYINKALVADSSYANAYSYLGLLYREQLKVETDDTKRKALENQANDATEKFQELNRRAAAEQGG